MQSAILLFLSAPDNQGRMRPSPGISPGFVLSLRVRTATQGRSPDKHPPLQRFKTCYCTDCATVGYLSFINLERPKITKHTILVPLSSLFIPAFFSIHDTASNSTQDHRTDVDLIQANLYLDIRTQLHYFIACPFYIIFCYFSFSVFITDFSLQ